jgi:hypothetical protein
LAIVGRNAMALFICYLPFGKNAVGKFGEGLGVPHLPQITKGDHITLQNN